jgi:hypothetical protein
MACGYMVCWMNTGPIDTVVTTIYISKEVFELPFSKRKLIGWLAEGWEPWIEIAFAVAGGLLSTKVEPQEPNLWNRIVTLIIYAIVGASVPFVARLYFRLRQAVPTVDALDKVLLDFKVLRTGLENRLLPSLYFTNTMKSFHEEWISWRSQLCEYEKLGSLDLTAWTLLADAYLDEERRRIKDRYVLTDTKQYTALVTRAGECLKGHHLSNDNSHPNQLVRQHITGMLPEEFYNGSQIEFTANSSQPIFLCHKWEGYQEFYASKYQGLDHKTEIKRCIIVRQPNPPIEELSALSTLNELQEQAKLSIIARERNIYNTLKKEIDGVQERLFRKCSPEQQKTYKELIDNILGIQKYKYWPIARTEDIKKNEQVPSRSDSNWCHLLDVFSNDFHGNKPGDASYCVLSETEWDKIKKSETLKQCFKPGWIPEIVLFGGLGGDGRPEGWYFGIMGHWRPFTSDIELRFLTSQQANKLYDEFMYNVYQLSDEKGNLLELKKKFL